MPDTIKVDELDMSDSDSDSDSDCLNYVPGSDTHGALFATSPFQFRRHRRCSLVHSQFSDHIESALTNKGVRLHRRFFTWGEDDSEGPKTLFFDTGCVSSEGGEDVPFVGLKMLAGNLYARIGLKPKFSQFRGGFASDKTDKRLLREAQAHIIYVMPWRNFQVRISFTPYSNRKLMVSNYMRYGCKLDRVSAWPPAHSTTKRTRLSEISVGVLEHYVGYIQMRLTYAQRTGATLNFILVYFSDRLSGAMSVHLAMGETERRFVIMASAAERMEPLLAEDTLIRGAETFKESGDLQTQLKWKDSDNGQDMFLELAVHFRGIEAMASLTLNSGRNVEWPLVHPEPAVVRLKRLEMTGGFRPS